VPDWSYQTVFRPVLFALTPETARRLTLGAMGKLAGLPGDTWLIDALGHMRPPRAVARSLFRLTFPSAVGLAAGLDPSGQAAGAFTQFGFGFLELGPVPVSAETPAGTWLRSPADEALAHTGRPAATVTEVKHRLQRMPKSDMLVGVRIGSPEGTTPASAAETVQAMTQALSEADFFTLEIPTDDNWSDQDWSAYLKAAGGTQRPFLLVFPPDARAARVQRLVRAGQACGAAGAMVAGGVDQNGVRYEGPGCLEPALQVQAIIQDAAPQPFPVIVATGIHDPADALRALDAGAALTAISAGFVFAGPGLPRRINEAVALRSSPLHHNSGTGWIYGALFAAVLLLVGLVAAWVAVTNLFLPYEIRLGGLEGIQRFPPPPGLSRP
jgi:dihydroorotate dehydrogenase